MDLIGYDGSTTIEFSWKPNMYTDDDYRALKSRWQGYRKPDMIVVSKTVHDVYDYDIAKSYYPRDHFFQQLVGDATKLARLYNTAFPKSLLVYRQNYWTYCREYQDLFAQANDLVDPVFIKHGFQVLPVYNWTANGNAPRSKDGVHQDARVIDVVLTAILSLLVS